MADDTGDEHGPEHEDQGDAARLKAVEDEQAAQGSKIDRILGLLGGDKPAADAPKGDGPGDDTIAEQVRKAVEKVGAEKAQAEAEAAHKAEHEKIAAEKAPRESASGWRGKLQKAMYGGDPQ